MSIYIYIICMALTTYLIRALPLLLFKKPIQNRFVRSFLHYVPVACLTAMTFPAILFDAGHGISGGLGCAVAVALALFDRSLLVVAAGGSATVFVVNWLLTVL